MRTWISNITKISLTGRTLYEKCIRVLLQISKWQTNKETKKETNKEQLNYLHDDLRHKQPANNLTAFCASGRFMFRT